MATDIIREAIIRLGIEISKDGLDKLDLGKLTGQAQQHAEATKAMAEAQEAANAEVSKAVETSASWSAGLAQLSASQEAVNQALQENRTAAEASADAAQAAAAAQAEQTKRVRDLESASRNYTAASAQAQEANLRAADAAKQVGDGAFGAARGFAFLAASSEESEAAMLRNIAVAQGAFDIFRGGVDIVRGLFEANKALTAASTAAAAAESAKAAAIAAGGTAAAAATPRLAAMNLALGPVGVGIAAISAAALAGVAIWRQWGDEGEDAAQRANAELAESVRLADRFNELLEASNRTQQLESGLVSDRLSFRSADDQLRVIRERLKAIREGNLPFSFLDSLNSPQLDQSNQPYVREEFNLLKRQNQIEAQRAQQQIRELEQQIAEANRDPLGSLIGGGRGSVEALEAKRDEVLAKEEQRSNRMIEMLDKTLSAFEEQQRRIDRLESAAAR